MAKTKYKLRHSKGKWRVNDNSYIRISDMETDHIQRALFFTANKIKEWESRIGNAKLNLEIFEQKKAELLSELEERGVEAEAEALVH